MSSVAASGRYRTCQIFMASTPRPIAPEAAIGITAYDAITGKIARRETLRNDQPWQAMADVFSR